MYRISITLLCCLFGPIGIVAAQEYPRVDVFGGYSYLNVDTKDVTSRQNANGWEASGSVNLNRWFAAEGDVSGAYKTYGVLGVSTTIADYLYLGGARVNLRPVFFHALVGRDRLSDSAFGLTVSQTGFAGAFGGGVQWKVGQGWSVRTSADYVFARHQIPTLSSFTENNFRVGAGVVYSFGGRRTATPPQQASPTPARIPVEGIAIPSLGVKAGTRDNGVEILEVESGGAAELAGLHVTDVINAVDQLPIRSAQELAAELSHRGPGSQVKLRYLFRSSVAQYQTEKVVILGQNR
jgi:hypothetical protein